MAKLGFIIDRPEFNGDPRWGETGDRYLIKLLKGYLFHQTQNGQPWVDLAHVVQTLNQLDSGSHEKVSMMSTDQKNVVVLSFADLKKALQETFRELEVASDAVTTSSER